MEYSLQAVHGRAAVARFLNGQADARVESGPWYLFAVGKAAAAMAEGARDALGGRVAGALLITKAGHCVQRPEDWLCLEAGHPTPDGRSLSAGERLLAFVDTLPPGAPVLSLLSGGASALVEVLPEGLGLEQLQRANDWLLGSGLDIVAMNRVRAALSLIKAGRLGKRLVGHDVLNLVISDVPGDRPDVIGSGLLVAAPDAGLSGLSSGLLPHWLMELVEAAAPAPMAGDPALDGIVTRIVATNTDARAAAVALACEMGLAAHDHGETLGGDAVESGARIARELRLAPPGLHVWGGETTVRLPVQPGRGGRNQALALAAAQALAGCEDVWLLAFGTDGTDGPTEDAGALVDGETIARGQAEGLDAAHCLAGADAGRFLAASGDLIQTGPTGTNVMDMVLALKRAVPT